MSRAAPPRSTAASGDEAAVDALLESLRGANRGVGVGEADRRAHRELIDRLVANRGGAAGPSSGAEAEAEDVYINNPLIFGRWDVMYTLPGPEQRDGEPAGGRFRGRIGRALFRTTAVMQTISPEGNAVVNEVRFKLFGLLPGRVSLTGAFSKLDAESRLESDGTMVFADEPDVLRVDFAKPVIEAPGGLRVRIGPPSSVVLQTTYLDERIRLGKGGRGSIFVFERLGDGEQRADGEGAPGGAPVAAAGAAALAAGLLLALARGARPPMPSAVAAALALAVAAVGSVLFRGGIVTDRRAPRAA